MSDSLWPYELQHARVPCPSLSPRVCSNSCPLSQCCHPTTSSSVSPFSFCPQVFPASEPFAMRRLFASGGQNIGASVSASVLPMNIQGWFPLGLTGLISLQSKRLSRIFSITTVQKHYFAVRLRELTLVLCDRGVIYHIDIFRKNTLEMCVTHPPLPFFFCRAICLPAGSGSLPPLHWTGRLPGSSVPVPGRAILPKSGALTLSSVLPVGLYWW